MTLDEIEVEIAKLKVARWKLMRKAEKKRYRAAHPRPITDKLRSYKGNKSLRRSTIIRALTKGTSLTASDIPEEMIELKRLNLKIKQVLKDEEHS